MSNDKKDYFAELEGIIEGKLAAIEKEILTLRQEHEQEKRALYKYIDNIENIVQQQNSLYAEKLKDLGGEW